MPRLCPGFGPQSTGGRAAIISAFGPQVCGQAAITRPRPGPQLPRAMRFKSGQWALLSVPQNAAIEGTRLCWSTRFSASAFLNPSVARQQFQAASLQKTSALAAPLGIEVPCAMGRKLRHWADRVREWLPLRDELRHTFPL
jgi:hypothetical protein